MDKQEFYKYLGLIKHEQEYLFEKEQSNDDK
jgi:hypothetical protein